ncbi:MAG: 6-phosphogluconate dehydrogenase, partial [Acidiphilium sp. 21-62-4]
MKIGIIGLGRMGANIARRLMRDGHECVVFDKSAEAVMELKRDGASGAADPHAMITALTAPRAVWVMLPSGKITEDMIGTLANAMEPGDIIIDGGNTFYKDDIRRAASLKDKGIHYVDVGTSGGIWGIDRGYCMMIGGESYIVEHLN